MSKFKPLAGNIIGAGAAAGTSWLAYKYPPSPEQAESIADAHSPHRFLNYNQPILPKMKISPVNSNKLKNPDDVSDNDKLTVFEGVNGASQAGIDSTPTSIPGEILPVGFESGKYVANLKKQREDIKSKGQQEAIK